jgi:hypothetical protein
MPPLGSTPLKELQKLSEAAENKIILLGCTKRIKRSENE